MKVYRRTGQYQRNNATVARDTTSASPARAEDLWPETPEQERWHDRHMEDEGMDSPRQIIHQADHDRTGAIPSAPVRATQTLTPNRQTPVVNNGVATSHLTMGEQNPPHGLDDGRKNIPRLLRTITSRYGSVPSQTVNPDQWTKAQGDDDNDNPHGWPFRIHEGGDNTDRLNKGGQQECDGIHRPRPTTRCHGEPLWISHGTDQRQLLSTHGKQFSRTMDLQVHQGTGSWQNADARPCRWLRRSAFELPAIGRPQRRRPDRRLRPSWRCKDV